MKRVILVLTIFLCSSIGVAQKAERLSRNEINANETPRAVAYNFVISIIEEDYVTMTKLMTSECLADLIEEMREDKLTFSEYFSSDNDVHDIVEMRPVVRMGYQLVIDDMGVLNSNDYSANRDVPMCYVSFDCVDANNKYYDGTYGKYDTTVDVYLVKQNGIWKVFEFK